MHTVKISDLYELLSQIEETTGDLLAVDDYNGYELYMIGLDATLTNIVKDDLRIITDDEYEYENSNRKYVKLINNLRYLTRDGIMHPLIGVLIDYVEDFIYFGGNER